MSKWPEISSDLGPIIKQGDDYTFQQQATVYNNFLKDFKEINDFKASYFKENKGILYGQGSCQSPEFNFWFGVQLCNCCVLLQPVVFSFQIQFCSLASSQTTHFT